MKRTLSLLLILLTLTTTALAQRGRGTILGTVTDTLGAVIPGATMNITNTATNVVTTMATNNDGYFTAPNLIVGAYAVAVTHEGFKKAVRSGLRLEVDQRAEINVTIDAGAVSETIEVSSQASLVDTTTATFGKVIDIRRVQELPVNGRNALSLVLLAPAVQSGVGPTASGFADRGTQVSFIRINGSPFAEQSRRRRLEQRQRLSARREHQSQRRLGAGIQSPNASGFYTLPTEAMRGGDFSKLADATGKPIIIYDPAPRATGVETDFLESQ